MLVKTPAVKLAVEIREAKVEDGRLALSGVANNMPCTVQVSPDEIKLLTKLILRPSNLKFVMSAFFRRAK